jgi:hypothetical protein
MLEEIIDGIFKLFKPEEKKPKREVKVKNLQPAPLTLKPVASPVPIPVALCLIIPAFLVKEVRENNAINISHIETLIDNAAHFICTTSANCDLIEKSLKLTDENILTIGERREVYIKIHIDDGLEMLEKKVRYLIKRNLPSNGQGVVKKIACLDDLSGLEKFNRV